METDVHPQRTVNRLVHITTVPITLRFLRGQAGYMRQRGLYVHVISSPGEELNSFGREERVPTRAVGMARRIAPLHDVGSLIRLSRELYRIRPTIVHAHTPKGGMLGMLAAWLTRVPLRIYHLHGLRYMTARGWRRRLLMATERLSCSLATRVLCVSDSIRDVAIADTLCEPGKIVVLAGGTINGVDADGAFNPDRFDPGTRPTVRHKLGIPDDALVIGFVGRIVRDKGIHELAEAWGRLRHDCPDAHLVLAGPIEPQDPIDPIVLRSLGDDSRVHLTGMMADTASLYVAFDLVALPTYREGFPNVPLEAAAMRLPVVATHIPGCVDAVDDGVTGTLVPARDAEALREAIASYLADETRRTAHGVAGRERVLRAFRQEDIWDAVYQEYARVARTRGIDLPIDTSSID